MNIIEIWQPRYKDNTVLIATYKVKTENYIKFTKAKHLEGRMFFITDSDIKQCPTQQNGNGRVYVVPMDLLKQVD